MPLTVNGKIDIRALPESEIVTTTQEPERECSPNELVVYMEGDS